MLSAAKLPSPGKHKSDWSYVVDRLPHIVFDTAALLAAEVCGAPVALLAFRQRGSLRMRAAVGLPGGDVKGRDVSWMQMPAGAPQTVLDDLSAEGQCQNGLGDLGLDTASFYAAVPLLSSAGNVLGILAIVDTVSRKLAPRRLEILGLIAAQMVAHIELSRRMLREGKLRAEDQAQALLQGDDSQQQLNKLRTLMESQRTVDELTGVKNERAFRDRLLEEFERYERLHQPFSLVMVELEKTDHYIELFGANAMNELLKRIAEWIVLKTRYCDIVARYGEYRFGIILPGTGTREITDVLQKFSRCLNENIPLLNGHSLRFGASSVPGVARTGQSLIEECLQRLLIQEAPAEGR